MKALYEKKVGAFVSSRPFWFTFYTYGRSVSWPFARLRMFKEYLIITILAKDFSIRYEDIDFIEKKFFRVVIHHHADHIDKYIFLADSSTGRGLIKQMRNVVNKNSLSIRMK